MAAESVINLSVRALRVQRGARLLASLDAVDVHAGEFVALIGPNGAGKSTVLKGLTGEWPADGHITLLGQPLSGWHRPRLAQHMAVMPQQSHLNFDFTVREVVTLGRLPHRGEPLARTRQAVDAALDTLSLQAFAPRRFTTLSGGERQRVQFARVIAQIWGQTGPRLLLLDEPTSALDLAQQQSVLDHAWVLAREGVTVVAVMHDLNMVSRYASRVLALHQGHLVADTTPADFMHSQRLHEVFGVQVAVERSQIDHLPVVLMGPQGVREVPRSYPAPPLEGKQAVFSPVPRAVNLS
ncbi:MAG TPA: heme ABC transporter ATP-binding protein [Burkholderiaceae bacterium]|nr:heme ABC transporter ATP-binding protein [Burkholderiaceae bacterium]